MGTYTEEDFKRIAAAVGKAAADVAAYQKYFENAALMFRVDRGLPAGLAPPRRSTPTQLRSKIERVERSARRLLKDLGVPRDERGFAKIEDAYDGPGDLEILRVLSWVVGHDEDSVIVATRRVGRLAEMLAALEGAGDIEQWARQGAYEVIEFGDFTVPKEHQGDVAFNDWIAAMLPIYTQISGEDPGTSVGAPGSSRRGKSGGPLIRFLAAAERPLGLEHSNDSLRDRVRDVLKPGRRRKK